MITNQQARIACDHKPHCLPAFVWYEGTETDYDTIEAALKDEGWIVDNGEHICPACVMEYESEQRELAGERERDEWADSPQHGQAKWINAGGL